MHHFKQLNVRKDDNEISEQENELPLRLILEEFCRVASQPSLDLLLCALRAYLEAGGRGT